MIKLFRSLHFLLPFTHGLYRVSVAVYTCLPSLLCTLLSLSFVYTSSFHPSYILLVPFSHCVEPVGRFFPLERGLGPGYSTTEHGSFFPSPHPLLHPLPNLYMRLLPPDLPTFEFSAVHSYVRFPDLFVLSICTYAKETMLSANNLTAWAALEPHEGRYTHGIATFKGTRQCGIRYLLVQGGASIPTQPT